MWSPLRHQTPLCYRLRSFSSRLPQSEIGYSRKDSWPIVWLTAPLDFHSFMHVKRLKWWRLCRNVFKKSSDSSENKSLKRQWIRKSRIFFWVLNPLNDIGVWMQIFIMTAMVNHGLSLTFTAVLLSLLREVWNRRLIERLIVIWRAEIWDGTLEPALEWMWTCIVKSLNLQKSHLQLPMWMYIDLMKGFRYEQIHWSDSRNKSID